MRQPKYKFGQELVKEVYAEVEGNRIEVTVTHYIVGISTRSSDIDFDYVYTVANRKPAAYTSFEFTTEVYEKSLTKVYPKVYPNLLEIEV